MPYSVVDPRYRPFIDSPTYYGKTNRYLTTTDGIDTTGIDNYREGINLRTTQDIYRSNQVKISVLDGTQDTTSRPNGELTHEVSFITYGQAGDFIQYTGDTKFNDAHYGVEGTMLLDNNHRISKTVQYLQNSSMVAEGLMDESQVYPLFMNNGPQYFEEAIIEVFPLPDRLASNESPQEMARGVFAFFEGGNLGDERRFGTNQIEQMTERDEPPKIVRPYLEEGAGYFIVSGSDGKVIKVIHTRPSAIPDQTVMAKLKPWVEGPNGAYFPVLTNTTDLLGVSVLLENISLDQPYYSDNYDPTDPELQTRDKKSSTAGYSYYGGNVGLYGTDSIAFGGLRRGST